VNRHFTSFTAEAMGALRQSMDAGHQARQGGLNALRKDLGERLGEAHAKRRHDEEERRQNAAHDRNSRQMFMNNLSARVESLKADVQKMCDELMEDRRAMAEELSAAAQAFRAGGASKQ
jgi:DNA repair ATPase RecN